MGSVGPMEGVGMDQSFLDKLRISAQQAVAQAQSGMAQGQARLDAFQLKRQSDGLLRDLGAAYYAQQRQGGDAADVAAALDLVDSHVAEHGPMDTAASAGPAASADSPPPPPAGPAGPAGKPTPPAGASFSLDDL